MIDHDKRNPKHGRRKKRAAHPRALEAEQRELKDEGEIPRDPPGDYPREPARADEEWLPETAAVELDENAVSRPREYHRAAGHL